MSSKNRGELRLSVKKLLKAQENGKRGPLNLSGGVSVYCYPGLLILLNDGGLKEMRKIDLLFSKQLSSSQIPVVDHPILCVKKKRSFNLNTLKKDDLFKYTVEAVNKYGLWARPHVHISLIKLRSTHKN